MIMEHDVFNISQRVKEIDEGYYVVLNTSKQKFEIHNSKQIGSSYCLTLPYSQLDERTLTYVYQTMSKNVEQILEKIENENKLKESAEKSSTLNKTCALIEDEIRR